MSQYTNKTTRQARFTKLLTGVTKHYPNVTSFTLGGVTYALDDLRKLVQGDLDAMTASAKAKADTAALVQQERNTHTKVDPVVRLFKSFVIAQFGDTAASSSTLEDFGYTPRKSSKPTLAVKIEAQGKTQATRKARHILGKKQKAKITAPVAATPPAVVASATKA